MQVKSAHSDLRDLCSLMSSQMGRFKTLLEYARKGAEDLQDKVQAAEEELSQLKERADSKGREVRVTERSRAAAQAEKGLLAGRLAAVRRGAAEVAETADGVEIERQLVARAAEEADEGGEQLAARLAAAMAAKVSAQATLLERNEEMVGLFERSAALQRELDDGECMRGLGLGKCQGDGKGKCVGLSVRWKGLQLFLAGRRSRADGCMGGRVAAAMVLPSAARTLCAVHMPAVTCMLAHGIAAPAHLGHPAGRPTQGHQPVSPHLPIVCLLPLRARPAGTVALQRCDDDMRLLQLEVAELQRSLFATHKTAPSVVSYDRQIAALKADVLRARKEADAFGAALESPQESRARLRMLPGKLPSREELEGRVATIEERLGARKDLAAQVGRRVGRGPRANAWAGRWEGRLI